MHEPLSEAIQCIHSACCQSQYCLTIVAVCSCSWMPAHVAHGLVVPFKIPVAMATIRPPAAADTLLILQGHAVCGNGAYVFPRSAQRFLSTFAELQRCWPTGNAAKFQGDEPNEESCHTSASAALLLSTPRTPRRSVMTAPAECSTEPSEATERVDQVYIDRYVGCGSETLALPEMFTFITGTSRGQESGDLHSDSCDAAHANTRNMSPSVALPPLHGSDAHSTPRCTDTSLRCSLEAGAGYPRVKICASAGQTNKRSQT